MMKLIVLLILIAFLPGCKQGKEAVKETKKIVKDYSNGLIEAPKKTRIITEIASIRKAINMYRIENNKYPESLSELSVKIKDTAEYQYNPETGRVKSKHYPEL